MVKRVRSNPTPEVQAAVDDILNGTAVNSACEWLQREYIRLMRREARMKQECESKLKAAARLAEREANERSSNKNRPVEQHCTADNGVGADQNSDNMHSDAQGSGVQ